MSSHVFGNVKCSCTHGLAPLQRCRESDHQKQPHSLVSAGHVYLSVVYCGRMRQLRNSCIGGVLCVLCTACAYRRAGKERPGTFSDIAGAAQAIALLEWYHDVRGLQGKHLNFPCVVNT